MLLKTRKAFTMIELTFAIVIIGILSAVAIPKLAATRDDAIISKARVTVASLRNAISTERQLRILRGNFNVINSLDSGNGNVPNNPIFDRFDLNVTGDRVLEYPMRSCSVGASGCWIRTAPARYSYRFPDNSTIVVFDSNGSRFDCVAGTPVAECNLLTR